MKPVATQHCAKCARIAGPSGYCYVHTVAAKNRFFLDFKRLQAMKTAAKEARL